MLDKQLVAEVVLGDLVVKRGVAVQIRLTRNGLYNPLAVNHLGVGVVQRIYVNRKPKAMIGNTIGVGDEAEVEAGRVVVFHRALVVGVVLVHESNLLDGIAVLVELTQNVEHVLGNVLVHDHLALVGLAVLVLVKHVEVTQILSWEGAVVFKRLALNAGKNVVGYLRYVEGLLLVGAELGTAHNLRRRRASGIGRLLGRRAGTARRRNRATRLAA